MLIIVGSLVVIGCVFGGYAAMGGHLSVLWQPFEYVIICGAAIGAYITSNTKAVISHTGAAFKDILKGAHHTKQHYLELLSLLYRIFKLIKSKGMLALEAHIENPEESDIFTQSPTFLSDHHAVVFLCDYLRIMTMGTENPHQIEALLDEELDVHHAERHEMAAAIQGIADAMPALGIVAAVLGVIKTMGAITEPPEVLGKLIGGALVGTFAGVFIAYGYIGPFASAMTRVYDAEGKYYQCIKVGLLSFLQGAPPAIAIEFARKAILSHTRPTFQEVEEAVS